MILIAIFGLTVYELKPSPILADSFGSLLAIAN